MLSFKFDSDRTGHHQSYDEHSKRQRPHVVGVVGAGGDVQKESQVHAHLGDGEHGKAEWDARSPEQRSVGDPNDVAVRIAARASPIV
jgi:hypothetical protein